MISDETIREVEALAEFDRDERARKQSEEARLEAFAHRIARDAIYAYASGVPLGTAIRGSVKIAMDDW